MWLNSFEFKIMAQRGAARAGELTTPHGIIKTPVFMPVGTGGSVKSLDTADLEGINAQVILGNTYHLWLRPGTRAISWYGGLHSFMGWRKPILTDSGGFQVSSLGLFRRKSGERLSTIDDDGVTFRSHIDGAKKRLTPELAMEIQGVIGSDIMMAFDEATPNLSKTYAKQAMKRTHLWLLKSKRKWQELQKQKIDLGKETQALFGIVQGGRFTDLRQESAKFVTEQNLPGIALGGESVGVDNQQTQEAIQSVSGLIPPELPLYTLGLGTEPMEVIQAIEAGADMFDCVAPTRLARCGLLYCGNWSKRAFVSEYAHARLPIERKEYSLDKRPIMEGCDCYTCTNGYSRGYLHHLFKAKELTYFRLATIHNVRVMLKTTELMRKAILGIR